MIQQEYLNGGTVMLALIVAIAFIFIIIWAIDKTPIGPKLEQEKIDIFNNNNVIPIMNNAIIKGKTNITIKDYWGYKVKVILPKYGTITSKLKTIIENDVIKIINENFN